MSKLTSVLNQSNMRRDNYSVDIKDLRRATTYFSPFAKKKLDSQILKRNKTPSHFISTQNSRKELVKKNRKFSLIKGSNCNHSVSVDEHLINEKLERGLKLLNLKQYCQSATIFKSMLIQPQIYEMLIVCLREQASMKEQQHFLTKYINEFGENYWSLIERGKVRYKLGAKELALRDFKSSVYVSCKSTEPYSLLCDCLVEMNSIKEAGEILREGINKCEQPFPLEVKLIELLLEGKKYNSENYQLVAELIKKLMKSVEDENGKEKDKRIGDLLYLQGKLEEYRERNEEACIYYEESLKYNSSKESVSKSMERIIIIKINERDLYEAYHTVKRDFLLNVDEGIIRPYSQFLEGVIMLMKKKFSEGVKILQQLNGLIEKGRKSLNKKQYITVLEPLMYKHLAYGYFCLGFHQKVIFMYRKLKPWGYDESSSYNLLLAQGIISVQKHGNFQLGIQKFQQAKFIYPKKVQPHLYIAMTIIYRALQKSKNSAQNQGEVISAVLHALEEINEAFEDVLDSSSNLLYHRTIVHFFLCNWQVALEDINRCIQKAEENLPKYFYLRGLANAVLRNYNKAINEYCISLSLSNEYFRSLLERAKCYFLLGETDNGFLDLKKYLNKNQNDNSVHLWIGNLLYEGKSYSDAIRAYEQAEESLLKTYEMKAKCMMRTGRIQNVRENLTKMGKLAEAKSEILEVDFLCLNIIQNLSKENIKEQYLSKEFKALNYFLEENKVGYVFKLIDCMNILAAITFYMGRYEDSYESLLLLLELYSSLSQKNKSELKSDCSQENLSLEIDEIYHNIFLNMVAMKEHAKAVEFIKSEFCSVATYEHTSKQIFKIIEHYEKETPSSLTFTFPSLPKNQNIKFKQTELKFRNLKIKCKFTFSLFHETSDDLFSDSIAKSILYDLKPSYIDNLPEGPWIKRNEHGVVFTGQILEGQESITLLSSAKGHYRQFDESVKKQDNQEDESMDADEELQRRKRELKRLMKLDPKIENKINHFIKKQ